MSLKVAFEIDISFGFLRLSFFVLRLLTDSHWLWSPLARPMCTTWNAVYKILEKSVALQILCTFYTLGKLTTSQPP